MVIAGSTAGFAAAYAIADANASFGDGNIPPTFTLTLTEPELDYLHEILVDECLMFPDAPELESLLLRVKRLKGLGLHVVN